MNFRCGCCNTSEKSTLDSLRDKLWEIQKKINQCSYWGLSEKTQKTVITELEAQKIEIKMQMHQLINEM